MLWRTTTFFVFVIYWLNGCENFKINSDFGKFALKTANQYRSDHQVKPLKLEKNLSAIAQKVAESLSKSTTLKHTTKTYKNKQLGENLAMWSKSISNSSGQAGKHCVDLWYKELKDHDFKKDYQKKSGHFSQLVWKSSTHVGFGIAVTKQSVICVAEFYPAGNVLRKFKDNVLAKKKPSTTSTKSNMFKFLS